MSGYEWYTYVIYYCLKFSVVLGGERLNLELMYWSSRIRIKVSKSKGHLLTDAFLFLFVNINILENIGLS